MLSFGVCDPIVGADPCRQRSGKGLTLNTILKTGFALGVFLLPTLPDEAAGARKFCEAEVGESLDLLEVAPSDIREITYDAQYSGRDNRRLVRLLAWVGLHSCKGYVIVDLTRQCTVREVYGRGECNLGGAVKPW
jgi:hypothetical protein